MTRYFSRLTIFCLAAMLAPLGAQQSAPAGADAHQTPQDAAPVGVAVLRYGSFATAEGMGGISSTTFAAQMKYLKEQGITPVSLQQFIDWRLGHASLSGPCVLITLDEADASAYTVAFPVLKQYGFPFVLFVDGRSFQDSTLVLDATKLKEMQQGGATIGSRSLTRPQACDWQYAALAGPDASQKMAERELGLSAQRILNIFGPCEAFSYPRGYANEHIVENLAIYGYKVAFGLSEGKVQRTSPAYMLNRYLINDMPDFARAVNFGAPENDDKVLLQVHAVAASDLPVSRPAEVTTPDTAVPVMPIFPEKSNAPSADLLPLPPVVEPLAGLPMENSQDAPAPIPAPAVEEHELPVENLTDPVLTPRPVSTTPAAGKLVRRTPGADWTTETFTRPVVPREQTRVSVLGYHNFSNTKSVSDMRMRTSEFCQQMQYIQDAGLTVITMQDFLDWLLGSRCLPERCVLITIDDGWRSVYTDAYPVLRAYGYPFTLYLYTSYLSGRGQSMAPEMIREMMAGGATIGSHSTSHLYPSQWKRYAEDSPEYAAQLKQEFPDSVARIKELFGNCSTYCYPGGYVTPPMPEALRACGVQAAFTVLEKKVTTLEDPLQVHRYMVLGTDPRVFRRAVNFDDVPGIKPTAQGITEARARAKAFFPAAFEAELPPAPKPPEAEPATGPISAPEAPPAPKVKLDDIPEPNYATPAV